MEQHIHYIMSFGNKKILTTSNSIKIDQCILLNDLNCYRFTITPGITTIGKTYNNIEQVLHFTTGLGEVRMNEFMYEVRPGTVVTIPKNTFHYFINKGKTDLSFTCIASGPIDYSV